ncbi:MAG: hypothetical protein KDC35_03930 [Acidobacteria bacterium]|nr:hypothetical protein [Acidobacteriota bacterium]
MKETMVIVVCLVASMWITWRSLASRNLAAADVDQVANTFQQVNPQHPLFSSYEDQILYVQGDTNKQWFADNFFGMRVEALAVKRTVEVMVARVEKQPEGRSRTTYDWSPQDALVTNQFLKCPSIQMGSFNIDPDFLDQVRDLPYLPCDESTLTELPQIDGFFGRCDPPYFVFTQISDSTQPGDFRVSFQVIPPTLSLFGLQKDQTLHQVKGHEGRVLGLVAHGIQDSDTVLAKSKRMVTSAANLFLWLASILFALACAQIASILTRRSGYAFFQKSPNVAGGILGFTIGLMAFRFLLGLI